MASTDAGGSLLVAILDLNPFMWARAASDPERSVDFVRATEQALIFVNAHLSLRFDNKLALIASHQTTSEFVYGSEPGDPAVGLVPDKRKPANVYKQFMVIDDVVGAKIRALGSEVASLDASKDSETSMISSSLSKALACELSYKRIRPQLA
ncbi:RNA polymerase II transcription factor B subunit 4 [Cladochytrium tenue]|nr:RNA polymerase II transcription factor B subunit 4 [Cladochytrium tenue]